jgi:eukaryotic-like serine/threonine-protein kinase
MEAQHQSGNIIDNRYRILHFLGQGGIGTTYAAENLETGEKVALKVVSLRQVDDFKVLELFEREARILAQLDHPGIPHYVDSFQGGKRRNRVFYLVQQLAEGWSLAKLVEMSWHPDEAKVRQLAEQILDILIYLQQLTPPVIHRDIKPENIIYRADGTLFLVDFGAVQDVYHHTLTGGSTVVGTYGYMAPEQFRGKAVLATDLYGLGGTLIFLLTRKVPSELPQRKLKIDFRSHVRIEKGFYNWLDRLIEPVADDRFLSAKEALAVLHGKPEFERQSATPQTLRPANSPITLMKDEEQLFVDIPPIWLRSSHSRLFGLYPAVINGVLLIMLWITAISSYELSFVGSIYLGLYGLFGLWLLTQFLASAIFRTNFKIDPQEFYLQRYFLGRCYKKNQGRIEEISEIELKSIGLSMNKSPITVCTLRCRLHQYHFGCFLTEPEKEWLVTEIREFLENSRSGIFKK